MPTPFDPPGPGAWDLDRSHFTGGATPLVQWLIADAMETAFRIEFANLGIPAETMNIRFVNGFMYSRLRPLIAPDKPVSKPPPAFVLKIATRLHPEFRRRTKAAAASLDAAGAATAEVIADWHERLKPELIARNLEFGRVDLTELDDEQLAGHVDSLVAYVRDTYQEHFRLHGYDMTGIGFLLHATTGWGIPSSDVIPALAGASPSTVAPLEAMREIRNEVLAADIEPESLDDIENASPRAAELLADYLEERGKVLYAGYDLDSPTLGEAPHVLLATIMADTGERMVDDSVVATQTEALRARVPADERDRFDQLVAEAREAMDLRDDNGPVTAEWPTGLLRLGLLEAGRRLFAAGAIDDAEHIFELSREELSPTIQQTSKAVGGAELAARAAERSMCKELDPPLVLGDAEPPPPLDALPGPLATVTELVQTVISELGFGGHDTDATQDPNAPLSGVGIGQETISGVACVAESADEAFDKLRDDELLVTRTTSPAYNMVLGMVSGLVTAEGGPMCHAAVLSRELAIPAVIGARGVMDRVSHGDTIEIDPTAGTVKILRRAAD